MKFIKNQIPRPTLKPIIIGKPKPIDDSKFFKVVQPPPPPRKQNKKTKK
jgi:hypothetical protein|tara:strand:+ start:2965 stop:3111 length:147 start_codon:yes stop_codon:yes gene_type:complete